MCRMDDHTIACESLRNPPSCRWSVLGQQFVPRVEEMHGRGPLARQIVGHADASCTCSDNCDHPRIGEEASVLLDS